VGREELDLPDELYGFGGWLLWLVATRATALVDRVYALGLARRSAEYGTVDGHDLPTPSLIAWLIVAAESGVDVIGLADRKAELLPRQKSLRTLVSRAISTDPRALQVAWIRGLGALCGLSGPEVRLLVDSRDDGAHPVDPRVLRRVVARAFAAGWQARPPVLAAARTLPRDVAAFTGRAAELRLLMRAGTEAGAGGVVQIHAIGGMAGVGKTAFATHAAHKLAPHFPDGQIFLSLNGHTPGQRPADPGDALASLLLTTGVDPRQIPPGVEPRSRLWRDRLSGKRILLVLDDALGHEQVSPLLPGTPGSLVLITSRMRLTALPDAHAISLDTMAPDEAAELFIRLSGRPSLDASAVTGIVALCGHLPLAVSMLARQLHHHPAWTPRQLATSLASGRDRLELMRAENVSVAAALSLSYRHLPPDQRLLFRRLGLHPGTECDKFTAAALSGTSIDVAERGLVGLYDQHLIAETSHGRFRMHDLVSYYARQLAADDTPEASDQAVRRLLSYYLRVVRIASSTYLIRRNPLISETLGDASGRDVLPDLSTSNAAREWLDAERTNLFAATAHAAADGRTGFAVALPAAMHGYLRHQGQGQWEQVLALYNGAARMARKAGDWRGEANALTDIGDLLQLQGNFQEAAKSLAEAVRISREHAEPLGEANALSILGNVQRQVGDSHAAAATLTAALRIHRQLGDLHGIVGTLAYLAELQLATGDPEAAAAGLAEALELQQRDGSSNLIGEGGLRNFLGRAQHALGNLRSAAASHELSLRIQREIGNQVGEGECLRNLAAVQQEQGDYASAAANLDRALTLNRHLGRRPGEAMDLYTLGILRCLAGDYERAKADLRMSMRLHRRLGDKFGEARALNGMGELALAAGEPVAALCFHERALTAALSVNSLPEQARAHAGLRRATPVTSDCVQGDPLLPPVVARCPPR
jgi:tetratricopeptide (TPR) repeat protein